MPIRVWVEIHDLEGNLLATIEAGIRGGTVTVEYPVFEPGTWGRVTRNDQYADGEASASKG